MTYYILKQDPRIAEQPSLLDSGKLDPLMLIEGSMIADPGEIKLSLTPNSGTYRGDIIDGLVTLFHKAFITELTKIGIDNLQYFPVLLQGPTQIENAFSLVNIIGLIEAVDKKNSVIEPRPGGLKGRLCSFKIDHEKAKGHAIFRIKEQPSLIIINESLREKLLVFNPMGVLILPTERYDGWG